MSTQALEPGWLDNLLGITLASAHSVPSDWWSVSVEGGTPTRLTHLAAASLYASPSPDGKYFASYSGNGIFVMKPDGTQVTAVVPEVGPISGTVNWMP